MTSIADYWSMGGWPMYLILLCGLGAAALFLSSVALSLQPHRARAAVVCSTWCAAFGVIAIAIGGAGSLSAEQNALQALAYMSPDDRARVLADSRAEATVIWNLALIVALPAVVAGGAVFAARCRRILEAPAARIAEGSAV